MGEMNVIDESAKGLITLSFYSAGAYCDTCMCCYSWERFYPSPDDGEGFYRCEGCGCSDIKSWNCGVPGEYAD